MRAYALVQHLTWEISWEKSMTTRLISNLLETRHAAEMAYLAKQNADLAYRLQGLSRQMFNHLTTGELAEMAMMSSEQSAAA